MCLEWSKELSGGQGKPRAPERWPESFRRSLYGDFQVEAVFCQMWLFSVFLGRLEEEEEEEQEKEKEKEEEKGE